MFLVASTLFPGSPALPGLTRGELTLLCSEPRDLQNVPDEKDPYFARLDS